MERSTAILLLALAVAPATVEPGPITFTTALPVSRGQGVLRWQYLHVQAGDDPSALDRHLTVDAGAFAAAVGVTSRLAVFGMLPVATKSLEMESPGGRLTRRATGVGDLLVFGRYTALASDRPGATFRVAPLLGLEIPTGSHTRSDALGALPRVLQPGSGSWDGVLGVTITRQTRDWQWDADVVYRRNNEADGFQSGDEVAADVSFQYRVWPRRLGDGVPAFVYAVVESNLVRAGRSEALGVSDPDTGGTRWDVDVGVQYVRTRVIVEAALQVPVVEAGHGTALESDYRLTAGARWNVSLPF